KELWILGCHRAKQGLKESFDQFAGLLGELLALTGEKLNGAELVACDLATHYSLNAILLLNCPEKTERSLPFELEDQFAINGKFDLVCSMESREHMPDKPKVQFTKRETLMGSNEKGTIYATSKIPPPRDHNQRELTKDSDISDSLDVNNRDDIYVFG
ncbi:hypothetical protein Tco_0670523, partial [Tanacetum coccineum]